MTFTVLQLRRHHAGADDPASADALYARNVTLFYAYRALMYFFLWMPVWFIYLQRMRGLTITQISLIGAAGWLASSVAQVPTGAFADVLGRRLSLAFAALGYAAGMVGYAFAPTFWLILLADVLWTVAFAFMSGADLALLYDSLKARSQEGEYTKVAGRAGAIRHGAQAAGSLIGAPLALLALNLPMIISAGVALMAGLVALQMRDPPSRADGPASSRHRSRYRETITEAWRILRCSRKLRYILLYYLGINLPPFLLTYIFLQPYATALGVPVAWMGALVVALQAASLAGAATAHSAVLRVGQTALLYAIPVVIVGACLIMAAIPSVLGLLFLAVVHLFGALSLPLVTAILNRQVPSVSRATLLSFAALVNSLGVALAQPLLGAAADRWGVVMMVGIMGAGAGLIAGVALMRWLPDRL